MRLVNFQYACFCFPIDCKQTAVPRDAVVQVGRRLDVSPQDAGRRGVSVCIRRLSVSQKPKDMSVELMLCDEVDSLCFYALWRFLNTSVLVLACRKDCRYGENDTGTVTFAP